MEIGDTVLITEKPRDTSIIFVKQMDKYRGQIARINDIDLDYPNVYYLDIDHGKYMWHEKWLKKLDEPNIVVFFKGKKSIARFRDCEGVAKCHEDDTFDYTTGATIAIQRAVNKYTVEHILIDTEYFVPSIECPALHYVRTWNNSEADRWYRKHNLVFFNKDDAINKTKEMLGIR